jgi:ABC-type branched-subunit amino acid transport system permease subunit/ABC-type branched-subunit amino acid transport system ATPase component
MNAVTLTLPLIDFEIPSNVVVLGIITGLTYALIGIGLTLVYRTSRVLNLAAGEMGALPAFFVPLLVLNHGWPYWVTLLLTLVGAALLGGAIEFLVIRRLARAPRLTMLVATIGLAQVLLGLGTLIPSAGNVAGQRYPTPFSSRITIGSLVLGPGQLMILATVPLVTLALISFLRRSPLGRASRAAADNPEAAQLAGVPTARVSFAIWTIAGLLAGIAAILIGPTRPLAFSQALGPALLLRALSAAMLGGLVSIPATFAGGVAIGVCEALILWNYPVGGILEVVLVAIILVSLLLKKGLGAGPRGVQAGARSRLASIRPLPPELASHPRVRVAKWVTLTLVLVLGILAPLVLTPSNQFMLSTVVLLALTGVSLVVLTGYAGHVSLGQFAFLGVGAAVGGRLYQLGVPHLPAIVLCAVAGAAVAWVIGLPALRIRGLFLAVTTLGFALITSSWLFKQDWLVTTDPETGTSLQIPRPELFGISFENERNNYWLCLTVLVVVSAMVYRLRRSALGRAMIAVRDNEASAGSLSLSPRRVKLTAFVISGAVAAVAGFLYGSLLTRFSSDPGAVFSADESLAIMVTAVFGGVTTITGAVLGAMWVEGIPRILGDDYALVSSGFGLILVLLVLPGGLASVVFQLRDRVVALLVREEEPDPASESRPTVAPATFASGTTVRANGTRPSIAGAPPLRAEAVTVSFGGLQALRDVSIVAERGEILGIMGPNGAGKTTLFDALSGQLRLATGRIFLDERDVTTLAPYRRARLGLGRSHQQARLFGDLTLVESIALAYERQRATRTVPCLLGTPGSRRRERSDVAAAESVVDLLELGRYAHRPVDQLPTGTRRLAELACVTALDAHVLLLDEPTAGFTPHEIESFGRVVHQVRDHLDATIVVIDHDVPMMRSLVDRLYVLALGAVIAEGPPTILDTDGAVAEAFLGVR